MKKVIIIGGGAAGMAAAIAALREGAKVLILEHGPRPGKKILSTGNGKCNLTNLTMPKYAYRGQDPDFAKSVLQRVPVAETLDFFREIGILTTDRNGYVYPNSGQASSVLDALRFEVERLGGEICCGCQVLSVEPGWVIRTSMGIRQCDALILAAGSMAAPSTGSDGSGYGLAKSLGHHVIKPLPALVQLCCRENRYKQLAGVRSEAEVSLLVDGMEACKDRGELQFADYGISGIPVFQVSRYASRGLDEKKRVTAVLDLLPSMEEDTLRQYLFQRRKLLHYRPAEEFLNGMFNKKLASVILKESGITPKGTVREITDRQTESLVNTIKAMATEVTATKSFDQAQVCCGGVDTKEVDSATMESKKQDRLYFAGEILDVDGICGGYNLQWAWSSGILAGRSAGKERTGL